MWDWIARDLDLHEVDLEGGVAVARGEERPPDTVRRDRQFFSELTRGGFQQRLSGIDFASGELPQPAVSLACGPAPDQVLVTPPDNRCDNGDKCWFHGFAGPRQRVVGGSVARGGLKRFRYPSKLSGMAEIRSRRARMRLRTVLIGAPFLVSGVAFTSLGISASVPTTLLWVVGFGVVALAIGRLRSARLRWVGRAAADDTLPSAEVLLGLEEANVVRSRPNKPSKPREGLRLPPHVVALLKKFAVARAAGRAVLPSQAEGGGGRGGLDVTLPSYDPWRDED